MHCFLKCKDTDSFDRMVAEKGYVDDPFVSLLYPGKKRHLLPLINRGTWARVESVTSTLVRFVASVPDAQVLSLGGGFDSNYFLLRRRLPEASFRFLEVDFPELIKQKVRACERRWSESPSTRSWLSWLAERTRGRGKAWRWWERTCVH